MSEYWTRSNPIRKAAKYKPVICQIRALKKLMYEIHEKKRGPLEHGLNQELARRIGYVIRNSQVPACYEAWHFREVDFKIVADCLKDKDDITSVILFSSFTIRYNENTQNHS